MFVFSSAISVSLRVPITKPLRKSTRVSRGRRPFPRIYFHAYVALNARSGVFRGSLLRVPVTIMARTVYRAVLYLRARICSPRIRCVRGMHVCTYVWGRLYAHVRSRRIARERVSRILDAQRNALSRCAAMRSAATGGIRGLSCPCRGKRAIAKKCECRIVCAAVTITYPVM